MILVDEGETPLVATMVDEPTVEQDDAAVGLEDARQQLDERRLARAVLAQQSQDSPALDGEGDVIDRLCPPEALAEALELDQRT